MGFRDKLGRISDATYKMKRKISILKENGEKGCDILYN